MKKFALFALSLLLIGCSSKEPKASPHLDIEDSSVTSFLSLQSLNDRFTNGGMMEVEARFKNESSFNKDLLYKVDWFDKDGFLITNITTKWKRVVVQSKRDFNVRAVSPSDKAVNYKLRITTPDSDDKDIKTINRYEFKN